MNIEKLALIVGIIFLILMPMLAVSKVTGLITRGSITTAQAKSTEVDNSINVKPYIFNDGQPGGNHILVRIADKQTGVVCYAVIGSGLDCLPASEIRVNSLGLVFEK